MKQEIETRHGLAELAFLVRTGIEAEIILELINE